MQYDINALATLKSIITKIIITIKKKILKKGFHEEQMLFQIKVFE